jgi:alkylated DNA repair dioxygenase AlkB
MASHCETYGNDVVDTLQIWRRKPLFDQLSINAYRPGEGLKPHIDLARFEDGICIVSLISAAIMNFKQANSAYDVLLQPGDVLLLSGASRSVLHSW